MEKQFNYDDLPVVRIKAGKLRGYQSGGTYIFKGIPMQQQNASICRRNLNRGKE